MKSNFQKNELSVQEFFNYAHKNNLNRLYFPNGVRFTSSSDFTRNEEVTRFYVNLKKLYDSMINKDSWSSNASDLNNYKGVIAFGQAVKFPGYNEELVSKRKYLLFGPIVEKQRKIPIQPEHADFLVITRNKPENTKETISDSIRVVNKSIDQILEEVKSNNQDTISIIKEGILLFYDFGIKEIQHLSGIYSAPKRKTAWYKNKKNELVGSIY